MIITIDGPSGTGKSSVAKLLSQKLGWNYYNTGALYRALGACLLEQGWVSHDTLSEPAELSLRLKGLEMELTQEYPPRYLVQGKDMSASTRDHSLSLLVSRISAWPAVRGYLLGIQRQLADRGRGIFDGRDMGTIVFPHADLKIYLTASSQVRAERRLREIIELGQEPPSLNILREQIEQRDRQDMERVLSPLRKPEDAYLIDSTSMTLEEVVSTILQIAKQKKLCE